LWLLDSSCFPSFNAIHSPHMTKGDMHFHAHTAPWVIVDMFKGWVYHWLSLLPSTY
jgi:hypothetical protein